MPQQGRRQGRLLSRLARALESQGIPYWLESGTLLGAFREGDHLATHPRVDLGVEARHAEALLGLKAALGPRYRVSRCLNRSGRRWVEAELTGVEVRDRLQRSGLRPVEAYVTLKYPHEGVHRWVDFRNCKSADSLHFEQHSAAEISGQHHPVPSEPERYLSHRYGDWKSRRDDWIAEIEDGAIADDDTLSSVERYTRQKPPRRRSKVSLEGVPKERMVTMFFRMVDLLEKHGIRYWLDDGTLLGIIRDGDLIPWDHDMDVGIAGEDIRRVAALGPRLLPRHLLATRYAPHNWIPDTICSVEVHRPWELVTRVNFHIDLIAKYRVGDRYQWIDSKALKHLESRWYDELDTVEWRGRRLPIPANTEEYLELRYPNWRVPVKEVDTSLQDPTIAERGF